MAFGKVSWVLSVPARGLALADVPGSVFDAEALLAMPLAPDLRRAVGLALRAHGGAGVPVRCVVRPEIFTHGRSLAWLKEKLGPVTDHLNLSDGTAVKLIPGLRNHMFTYGLHAQGHAQEFKKLLRRAPELLGQIQSQVNSFHRVVTQGMAVEPKATLLSAAAPEPAAMLGTYAKADPSTVAVPDRERFYDVTYRGDLRNMIDHVIEKREGPEVAV